MTPDDEDFDGKLQRMERVAEVIGKIDNPDLQVAAFEYLVGTRGRAATPSAESSVHPVSEEHTQSAPASSFDGDEGAAARKTRTRRPSKVAVAQDKTVDLFPAGKQSFKDFAEAKKPANNDEKYAVAVFWLREVAEYQKATLGQIISCYLVAEWKLPSDVRNAMAQSGSKGYLISSDSDDIQLTSQGQNLSRNTLPRPDKK